MTGDTKVEVTKLLKLLMLFALGGFTGWMVHGIQSMTGTTNLFIVLTNQSTGESFAVPVFESEWPPYIKR